MTQALQPYLLVPRTSRSARTTHTGSILGRLLPASTSTVYAELQEAIPQLWKDIQIDACVESYGPECVGSDAEVDAIASGITKLEADGKVVDAKSILTLAGVDPTEANVKKFGECVKPRLGKATGSTPKGTLAYCALVVKRSGKGEKAHTSQAWRDAFETWERMWQVFVEKTNDQITGPDSTEVEKYRAQYIARRNAFTDAGGETSAPDIDPSRIIPRWTLWVGGAVLAYWGFTKVRAFLPF